MSRVASTGFEVVEFDYGELTKTDRPGKVPFKLIFHKYHQDENLDFMNCLNHYGDRTAQDRTTVEQKRQLFLSYKKPFKQISTPTISRWLKNVMSAAGIDTNVFSAHSTRSACTSKAFGHGLSIKQITDRANWSGATTFLKFYRRDIVPVQADAFQSFVLQISA